MRKVASVHAHETSKNEPAYIVAFKEEVARRVIDPLTSGDLPKGRLFHYTTAEAMKGILEKRCLWSSHAAHLNDRAEIVSARHTCAMSLDLELQTNKHSDQETRLLAEVADVLKKAGIDEDQYVVCLCEEGDLLSQWRGYAQQGVGFSIGFSGQLLSKLQLARAGMLRKVVYDMGEQIQRASNVVAPFLEVFRQQAELLPVESKADLVDEAKALLLILLTDLAYSFKSEAWREEREWRFITTFGYWNPLRYADLKFRPSNGTLVPYIEIALANLQGVPDWKFPLEKVVIGPALEQRLAAEMLRMLSEKCQHPFEIESSQVPLRS